MSEPVVGNPGEMLRKTRERLGLSVNDVSVATKINPRILKSLEEGSLEGLPARPFTRGFIRTYAAYLKLEPEVVVGAFNLNDESVSSSQTTVAEVSNERSRDTASDNALKSKALIASGIFVLIVLVVGIKKIVDRYAQESIVEPPANINALENFEPDEDAVAEEKTEELSEQSATAVEVIDPASVVPPMAAPVENPAAAVTSPPPAPVATPTATAPTPTPTPAPASTSTPVPKPSSPAKPQAQEIIIEALDQVELTIRVDGGSSRKLELKPENLHTIKAEREIIIESEDGGRINVVHNGKDKGVPGDLGKPVRLKFP